MFDLSSIDHNFIYLVLLAGLWLGVLAVYIPGTGLPEIAALTLVIGSIFVLYHLPTNWWAFLLLVLGVSTFLLLPFFGEKWGRFAEIGLIFQGLGAYFLFTKHPISLIAIAITLLLGLLYNRLVLIPALSNQDRNNEFSKTLEVIGLRGRVVKELNPIGTVYVNKELWRARSQEHLNPDTLIRVIAQDGLELIVEKAKHEDAPAYEGA